MIVRVATFNIRTGLGYDSLDSWPFRRSATAAAIRALGADVLGLQEVHQFQRRYLERRLPGGRWLGMGRGGGTSGEQCPIVVAHPDLDVIGHTTGWFGPSPAMPGTRLPGASFPRIATLARCRDKRSDSEFDVINTHLDEHIGDNRSASMRQLVRWLDAAVPTVVLGDFNAVPNDPAVCGPLTSAGFDLVRVTGGTSHGFTGAIDGPCIDHIFVSQHWTVRDAAVVRERPYGRLPSDHWPVYATLRLNGVA